LSENVMKRKNSKKPNIDLKESTMKAMKIVIFTIPAMSLAMNITILAVVWFGGKQIIAGSMTSGVLTAFVNYVIQNTHITCNGFHLLF